MAIMSFINGAPRGMDYEFDVSRDRAAPARPAPVVRFVKQVVRGGTCRGNEPEFVAAKVDVAAIKVFDCSMVTIKSITVIERGGKSLKSKNHERFSPKKKRRPSLGGLGGAPTQAIGASFWTDG
jgi:hypothetical protein